MGVVNATRTPYMQSMAETLNDFVQRRRREIEEAMQAAIRAAAQPFEHELLMLNRVEAMITDVGFGSADLEEVKHFVTAEYVKRTSERDRMTLKQRIIQVLRRRGSADALTILAEINRHWGLKVERTSLSPQLSRLKDEGVLTREGKIWTLVQEHKTPDEASSGAIVGVAGSPGSPEKAAATGSTPVTSTTRSLAKFAERLRRVEQTA